MSDVFQPLIDFFEEILIFFHDTVGLGWGMSIVALTVVVRAALMPLTIKQFKSMQNMAKFQPEIKKLQERYKGDRERLNQEMMKFYRENKVNPFASCLPLVAQLPVFLALFYMLQNDLRLDVCPDVNPPGTENPEPCGPGGAAEFLFIPDITDKATGGVLIALIVLYVGSQLLSTILMSTATDKTQRIIFLALPFVFVIFVINFPAGLLVYWITTNFWTIMQQAIVRKRLGPMRPATADGEAPPMSIMDRMLHRGERRASDRGRRRRTGTPAGGGEPANCSRPSRRRRAGPPRRRHRRRVRRRSAPGGADERAAGPERPPAERVRELLEHVNDALELDAEVEVVEEDDRIRGVLHGDDMGLFIGRHGQTIDAVQHLAFKVAAHGQSPAPKVEVDAAGYRDRRRQALERQADQAAADAVRSARPVALDAMSATERKVVHEYLKDRGDVETYSEGTEPDRHLVVAPLDA